MTDEEFIAECRRRAVKPLNDGYGRLVRYGKEYCVHGVKLSASCLLCGFAFDFISDRDKMVAELQKLRLQKEGWMRFEQLRHDLRDLNALRLEAQQASAFSEPVLVLKLLEKIAVIEARWKPGEANVDKDPAFNLEEWNWQIAQLRHDLRKQLFAQPVLAVELQKKIDYLTFAQNLLQHFTETGKVELPE